jgi:predicted nucleotidyltransferase
MKDHDFNLEYVLNILKLRKPEFAVSYGVSAIGVFGSLARGEEKPDSDVDVVVEMKKPDLFYMVHIKESLEEDLQCPVDVVRLRERMNPYLKTRIKKEAVYV